MNKTTQRAVIFDLDGTLTNCISPWQLIHETFGIWDKAIKYHDRFFDGEIDYDQWCKLDVALWRGHRLAEVNAIIDSIKPVPEAIEVLKRLSKYKNADGSELAIMILTSGFKRLANRIIEMAALPDDRIFVVANDLKETDKVIEGIAHVGLKADGRDKPSHVARFLKAQNVEPQNAVAVDDRLSEKETFKNLGAFIHRQKPADLFQVFDILESL